MALGQDWTVAKEATVLSQSLALPQGTSIGNTCCVRKPLLCWFWTTHHNGRKSIHLLSSLREWLHCNHLLSPLKRPNLFILPLTQSWGNISIGWAKTMGHFTPLIVDRVIPKYLLRDISSMEMDTHPLSLEDCGNNSFYLSWKPDPCSDIHLIFLHGKSCWLLLLVELEKTALAWKSGGLASHPGCMPKTSSSWCFPSDHTTCTPACHLIPGDGFVWVACFFEDHPEVPAETHAFYLELLAAGKPTSEIHGVCAGRYQSGMWRVWELSFLPPHPHVARKAP